MKDTKLFTEQVHFMDFTKIISMIPYVQDVEVQPVYIDDNSSEWVSMEEEANAFGVYFRYNEYAITELHMNPSEWVADFDTLKGANNFQLLLQSILNK